MSERLVMLERALYVKHYSDTGNILYGLAGEARRSAGSMFTVGAQLDGISSRGCSGITFGYASEAIALLGSLSPLVGGEVTAANFEPSNFALKIGLNPVFKDR